MRLAFYFCFIGTLYADEYVEHRVHLTETVFIPGGTYELGMTTEQLREAVPFQTPAHPIEFQSTRTVVTSSFHLDRFEVTAGEYRTCVKQRKCSAVPFLAFHRSAFDANLPMVGVTAEEAQRYCRSKGKSLPSDVQWEVAARGNTKRIFPWGSQFSFQRANLGDVLGKSATTNIDDGYAYAAPRGALPFSTSWSGAQNMAGNVTEWTVGKDGGYRLKGGSWMTAGIAAVVFAYQRAAGGHRAVDLGFRCVATS